MSVPRPPAREISVVKSLKELWGPVLAGVANRTGSLAAIEPLWRDTVGELASRHTRPARWEGGALVIACDATAWREVLQQEAPAVLAKLNAALGEARVDRLVFEVP
ncbi:MAG: DUF721 domain-containing protein [Myxococcota bacterium]